MEGRPEEIKSPRSTVIGKIRIVITLISCVSVWDPWFLGPSASISHSLSFSS